MRSLSKTSQTPFSISSEQWHGVVRRWRGSSEWRPGVLQWRRGPSERRRVVSEARPGPSLRRRGSQRRRGSSERRRGVPKRRCGSSERRRGDPLRRRGSSEWRSLFLFFLLSLSFSLFFLLAAGSAPALLHHRALMEVECLLIDSDQEKILRAGLGRREKRCRE